MGIPLESTESSSKNNIEEPRLPNTANTTRKSKSSLTGKQNHKKSARLASDSIGYYLSSIGRVPLLTAAEEIELAHHVQNMKKLLEIPENERSSKINHQIKVGKRARDRMMAANLRLVVSVAKKYQNQGLELLDLVQEGKLRISIIPDIESINYGRGVGYDVIQHFPPDDIKEISATNIRKKLRDEGEL